MQGTIDSISAQLTSRNARLRFTAIQQIVSLTVEQIFSDHPTPKPREQSALGTPDIFCAIRSILASEHETDENTAAAALAISNLAKDHQANQTYIGEKTDIIHLLIAKLNHAKTDSTIGSFTSGLLQIVRNHKANTNRVGTAITDGVSVYDSLAKIMETAEVPFSSKANVLVLINNLLTLLEPENRKRVLSHPSLLKNACLLLKPEPAIPNIVKINAHVHEILVMLELLSSEDASLFVNIPILVMFEALKYKDPKTTESTLFIMSKFIETQNLLAHTVAQSPMAISTLAALLKDYDSNDKFMAVLRSLYILRTLANTPSIDISTLSKNVVLNRYIVEVLACNNMSIKIYACNVIEQLAAKDLEFSLSNAQMEIVAQTLSYLFAFRAAGPRDAETVTTERYSKITALSLIHALTYKQAAFLGNKFIHDIVAAVKSDNSAVIFQAALAIEKLALEHIDNAARFLACPEFITNITAVLDSDRASEVKIPLIFALENIAGDNPAHQAAILSQIDIKHFLNVINSPDTSRLDSIRLLSFLLKSQPSTYNAIAANASVQKTLVEALSDSSPGNATLQKIAAHDIAMLILDKPEIQEMLGKNPEIFEGLTLAIKNNANYQAQANALSALFELTQSHPENQKRAGETAQLMDSVANLLTHENAIVKANAMMCFSNLCKHHANVDQFTNIGAVCRELTLVIGNSELSDEDRHFLLEIMPIISGQPIAGATLTPIFSSGGQPAPQALEQGNSQQPGP